MHPFFNDIKYYHKIIGKYSFYARKIIEKDLLILTSENHRFVPYVQRFQLSHFSF